MRNPIRRSRKIGKTQGGRVSSGRAREKLSRRQSAHDIYARISKESDSLQFIADNPSKGFFHPCSEEDYLKILGRLPVKISGSVKAIIMPRISNSDRDRGVEAKRRYDCVIMNPFPASMTMEWGRKPEKKVIRHFEPWCEKWEQRSRLWILIWSLEELRRYYLYHLFLHEIGHINQPPYHALNRREEFAENFALDWARKLGQLKRRGRLPESGKERSLQAPKRQ
jgi:hypothetical protein